MVRIVKASRWRWLAVIAAAGALVLALAACAGDEEAEEPVETEQVTGETEPATGDGGPLVVNAVVGPTTLDPGGALCGYTDQWAEHFYPQLVNYAQMEGPDGTTQFDPEMVEPELAASWEISNDERVYTFQLNPDATFADGSPIDSEAVKFSFERALSLQSCGAYFWVGGQYDNIPQIEALDPTTVVITLPTRPNRGILQSWSLPGTSIVQPSAIAEYPDDPPAEDGAAATPNPHWATNIAGNAGPFLLDAYEPGRRLVMKRNPDYFGPPPASDEIIVNFISSESTLLLQARSGEADVTIGASPRSIDDLRGDDNARVLEYTGGLFLELGLVNSKPPFDNVQFREAVTYAVPYQDILDNVMFGLGSLYYGPLPPGVPHHNPDVASPREFDLERAQQLVVESGVQTPVDIEFIIQEGQAVDEQIATIVQSTWRELGINTTITKLGAVEYDDATLNFRANAFIRQNGPGVLDPAFLLSYDMECEAFGQRSAMCIPEADELFHEARETLDENERQALYDEMTEVWRAHSPKIILFANKSPVVLSHDVETYFWHLVPFLEPVGK